MDCCYLSWMAMLLLFYITVIGPEREQESKLEYATEVLKSRDLTIPLADLDPKQD